MWAKRWRSEGAKHCHEEGQCPMITFLFAGSELSFVNVEKRFSWIVWSTWTRSSLDTRFLPWPPDHLHHEHLCVLLQSSCTIAALCCHSWKFHSFVNEFRPHCTSQYEEIELQHVLHTWQETIVVGNFSYSLHAQNWQVRSDTIDRHARNTAQHIWAKLHRIFFVVLISRSDRTLKKNSPCMKTVQFSDSLVFIFNEFIGNRMQMPQ